MKAASGWKAEALSQQRGSLITRRRRKEIDHSFGVLGKKKETDMLLPAPDIATKRGIQGIG